MTRHQILTFLLICTLAGCQPKTAEPINIGIIWKAQSVSENGIKVFQAGAQGNTRPGYEKFRLNLSEIDQVTFVDLDGRKLTGSWALSPDNQRLILTALTPPPSESSGNIEFHVVKISPGNELQLKRTNESRKTGNTVNDYTLVPE